MPLSREQFQAAYDAIAPTVAQTAAPGLSREQFNDLVIREVERSSAGRADSGPSFVDRAIPQVMRIGGTIAGSTLGAIGGPVGMAAGGAAGAGLGEYGAELYEQQTGQRKDINPTQLGVQTALGAIPMGRVAGSTVGQIAARRAAQGAGMGAVSTAATQLAETGDLPSAGQVAIGAGLGTVLGGAGGSLEGRGLRRLGRLETPIPETRPPAGLLPAGSRYQVAPDGRVAPTGTDIPLTPQPDGSFARGVPAEYARREVRGALPPGREPIPMPGEVAADPSFVRGVPAEFAKHEIAGLLPAGPRFTADASGNVAEGAGVASPAPTSRPDESGVRSTPAAAIRREIDPTQDPARAVTVRQFSGDPNATEAPLVGERERHILTVMRERLQEFPSQRGRLVRNPNDETSSIYAHGSAGSPVGDDVRAISGTRAGNDRILAAIDDLLAGKPLTNKLHIGALDAAQGYAEGRKSYRGPQLPIDRPTGGGGEAVNDFEKFAASLDEVSPSSDAFRAREPGEEGFATVPGLTRVAGAALGGTVGYATGDTPEERTRNAAIGMGLGAMAPSAPRLIAGLTRRDAAAGQARPVVTLRPRGAVNIEQPAGVLPRGSRAQGTPLRNPLAGTEGFVDRLSAGNPLLRDGITERLSANAGFGAQRRGALNTEQIGGLAEQVRVDLSRSLPRGSTLNAEGVVAYSRAVKGTMDKVRELSATIASGKATDADILALQAARADADVVLKSVVGARSEAGRALAQYRTFAALLETGDVNLIRKAATPLREEAAQLAAAVAQHGTPLEQYRFLQSQGASSTMDKVRSYYYANILSGIKTHERNAIGNAASIVSKFMSTPVAAAVDAAKAAATGSARNVYLGELQPAAVGAVAGFEKGISDFLFTLRHGVSPDALSRSVSAATEFGRLDVPRVEFGGGAGNPFNWPGRLLDAADTLSRSTARNSELYASSWAQAKREGLTGDQLIARAADLRADATLQGQAQRFAAETVFQHKPGPITGLLQALSRRIPGATFVVPFIRTPSNILRAGVQASPAGFFTAAAREGGRVGAQAQGLATMGTLALAPLAWLAATNRLSGSGPSDPAERAALMESGWRPNSVRVGEKWIEYSLFQPVSIPAAVMANAYEAWRRDGAKEQDAGAKVAEVLGRVGNTVLEQSFLSGLSDLFEALKSPERFGANWAGRMAQSFTPFAGLQRTVTQAIDPTIRQPKTAGDVFRSNVPGLSQSVQPRLTRWGAPAERPGGGATAVDPFNASPVVRDSVAAELSRLGVSIAVPSDRIKLPQGAELTTTESVAFREQKGAQLRGRLESVIGNPNFQRLPDALKVKAIERVRDASNSGANTRERQQETLQLRQSRREALMQQLAGETR